jgi:hypothetical protein
VLTLRARQFSKIKEKVQLKQRRMSVKSKERFSESPHAFGIRRAKSSGSKIHLNPLNP